jgi:biopolymer transport protein ExbD
MTSRGFLIRFIDIGLIVLFGFIMISEIEYVSQVDLAQPAPEEQEEPDLDEDPAFVTVRIDPDGSFVIVDPASNTPLGEPIGDADLLSGFLENLGTEYAADDRPLIVLINPHDESIVQWTVDVMDVCDRLGLGKSLQTGA